MKTVDREDDVDIRRKRTPSLSCHESLSRGQLKNKGGGKLSIHFSVDEGTIEIVFRMIISVDLLCLYGAVAEMCEEDETFPLGKEDPARWNRAIRKTS